ncbi:HIT-like domain-containing protein [Elsinoe ampelina]|uniref:HIT-like domain-containing protein n=1 Tax=Elsinoe ampelina TaxID=302913 RepID=A0A6A6FZU0_9PEZI|nr:HIT-like domain-containing protein [Elsinoe ampelina]
MELGLAEPLATLVRNKYDHAKQRGSLTFSETQLAILRLSDESKHNFQLRYCPALQKKPTQQKPEQTKDKKKFNPFENPDADLLIAEIPSGQPTHRLVLNKYPIIPNHFILATKDFAEQTDLLEPDDLAMTYAVLRAWEEQNPDGKLFAFFNSGPDSGASQPHRHLQFVPFEDMQRDVPEDQVWHPLVGGKPDDVADTLCSSPLPELPFESEQVRLPAGISVDQLHGVYVDLVKKHVGLQGKRLTRSYNLGMTSRTIAIAPRINEAYVYKNSSTENAVIAVNGTILAGTLMVKGEDEWNWLRNDPSALRKVLSGLGVIKESANHL